MSLLVEGRLYFVEVGGSVGAANMGVECPLSPIASKTVLPREHPCAEDGPLSRIGAIGQCKLPAMDRSVV